MDASGVKGLLVEVLILLQFKRHCLLAYITKTLHARGITSHLQNAFSEQ